MVEGKGKGKAALLSLYNIVYNEIARLEWRVRPEPLRLSVPLHWANLNKEQEVSLFCWVGSKERK